MSGRQCQRAYIGGLAQETDTLGSRFSPRLTAFKGFQSACDTQSRSVRGKLEGDLQPRMDDGVVG